MAKPTIKGRARNIDDFVESTSIQPVADAEGLFRITSVAYLEDNDHKTSFLRIGESDAGNGFFYESEGEIFYQVAPEFVGSGVIPGFTYFSQRGKSPKESEATVDVGEYVYVINEEPADPVDLIDGMSPAVGVPAINDPSIYIRGNTSVEDGGLRIMSSDLNNLPVADSPEMRESLSELASDSQTDLIVGGRSHIEIVLKDDNLDYCFEFAFDQGLNELYIDNGQYISWIGFDLADPGVFKLVEIPNQLDTLWAIEKRATGEIIAVENELSREVSDGSRGIDVFSHDYSWDLNYIGLDVYVADLA